MLGCAGSGRRFSAVDSFVGIPLLYVVVKAIVDENLRIPDDGKFIFVKLPKGRLYDGVMHNGCGIRQWPLRYLEPMPLFRKLSAENPKSGDSLWNYWLF